MDERLNATEGFVPTMGAGASLGEIGHIRGHYSVKLFEYEGGPLIWADEFDNVVTYAGQNQLLLQLTGNTTVVGPYLGIIGNNTTGPVVGDTMASHGGWTEAGNPNTPTYSGTRPTLSLNAPASGNISTSATGNFTFTGSGNVTGAFVVFSTNAVNTVGNTSGVLLSAGNFSAAQPVICTNVLTSGRGPWLCKLVTVKTVLITSGATFTVPADFAERTRWKWHPMHGRHLRQ